MAANLSTPSFAPQLTSQYLIGDITPVHPHRTYPRWAPTINIDEYPLTLSPYHPPTGPSHFSSTSVVPSATPSQQLPAGIFEWARISLEAFVAPTNRATLTPAEYTGHFHSARHARRYNKLVANLSNEMARLRLQQRDDMAAEQRALQVGRGEEAVAFHAEFEELLQWGRPSLYLRGPSICLF